MEGKGFFTKELQDALLERQVDLVVHSLKDLPTEEPEGLELVHGAESAPEADLANLGLTTPGIEDTGHRSVHALEDEAVQQGCEPSCHRLDVEVARELARLDGFPADERRDRHRPLAAPDQQVADERF
jgi:hypothetical protein